MDSVELNRGGHLAIVGPNGSGKTMLVDSLRRRYPRDIEYISFRDTYGDEADGAYYYQLRWNRQELANLIELESESKDLFSLSSGELRKHRIARALESEAEFIIIDNPYLGLDAGSRAVFTDSLAQIASEGSRTILDKLDWTVREGECWAVRGENGSGKSTLLSLVCADNPQAYACNIELFGHKRGSGESIWDIKRHIGYVSPEMHRAYQKNIPALDVVSSGLFDTAGLYMHADEQQKELCRRWMWIFGIDALADRPYLKLSSGEQRLCLLARAFVKDPELLILDEPMHGLDPQNYAWVKEIIDTFVKRPHKTLLFVTHFDEELPVSIDHTLMLKRNQ